MAKLFTTWTIFSGIVRAIPDAASFDRNFAEIFSDLGLKINEKKNKKGTVVEFLGIELDTHLMQARLPAEKLQKAKDLVQSTLNKSTIARNELDTLLGFLRFAAKVVVPGRSFLRRLFNSKIGPARPFIHINSHIKADLL